MRQDNLKPVGLQSKLSLVDLQCPRNDLLGPVNDRFGQNYNYRTWRPTLSGCSQLDCPRRNVTDQLARIPSSSSKSAPYAMSKMLPGG
jgi:hypothetical protein